MFFIHYNFDVEFNVCEFGISTYKLVLHLENTRIVRIVKSQTCLKRPKRKLSLVATE